MTSGRPREPHNALRKTLMGPNRIAKGQAVSRAEANLAEIRGDLVAGLAGEVEKLHRLARTCEKHLSQDSIEQGMILAGVLYNLAGATGFGCLQLVSASLSDLFAAMEEGGARCSDPVLVHALAAMLVAPGMPSLAPAREAELLGELKELVAFHRAQTAAAIQSCSTCPAGCQEHQQVKVDRVL